MSLNVDLLKGDRSWETQPQFHPFERAQHPVGNNVNYQRRLVSSVERVSFVFLYLNNYLSSFFIELGSNYNLTSNPIKIENCQFFFNCLSLIRMLIVEFDELTSRDAFGHNIL